MLTASRRLAHALRLGYAQHAQSLGQSVWRTPRILPWSTWLAQQWLEARAIGTHAHHSRLLTNAQARILWDTLVNNSEWGEHLLNPSQRCPAGRAQLATNAGISDPAVGAAG